MTGKHINGRPSEGRLVERKSVRTQHDVTCKACNMKLALSAIDNHVITKKHAKCVEIYNLLHNANMTPSREDSINIIRGEKALCTVMVRVYHCDACDVDIPICRTSHNNSTKHKLNMEIYNLRKKKEEEASIEDKAEEKTTAS